MRARRLGWIVLLLAVVFAASTLGCAGDKKTTAPTQPITVTETANGVGVAWSSLSFAEAMKQAEKEHKPVLVDMMTSWCRSCKKLDEEVWSRPDVGEAAKDFVAIKVDCEEHPDIASKLLVSSYPTTILLAPEGKELGRVLGPVPYDDMLMEMEAALKKL